ncbi:hypothetical protein WA158_005124 [Blastocystis sp. Blastoise]
MSKYSVRYIKEDIELAVEMINSKVFTSITALSISFCSDGQSEDKNFEEQKFINENIVPTINKYNFPNLKHMNIYDHYDDCNYFPLNYTFINISNPPPIQKLSISDFSLHKEFMESLSNYIKQSETKTLTTLEFNYIILEEDAQKILIDMIQNKELSFIQDFYYYDSFNGVNPNSLHEHLAIIKKSVCYFLNNLSLYEEDKDYHMNTILNISVELSDTCQCNEENEYISE